MRTLFISLALSIGAVMIATSAVRALSSPSTGSANLHPSHRSGVKARLDFVDSHDEIVGLTITGTATGLDPNKDYVSRLTVNDAVPGGPRACDGEIIDEERQFTAVWQVDQ